MTAGLEPATCPLSAVTDDLRPARPREILLWVPGGHGGGHREIAALPTELLAFANEDSNLGPTIPELTDDLRPTRHED